MTLLLALLFLQGPGDGWALVETPPREVKRVYWELFETTEVWISLLPEGPQGEPPLVNVLFQAFFPGRAKRDAYSGLPQWPKGKPARLVLRAQALPLTVVRELSLRLLIDGDTLDLTAPGSAFHYVGGCPGVEPGCSPTGVEAEIEPSLLQSLIGARTVEGQALGYPIELTEVDQRALAEFSQRIGVAGGGK